MLGGVLSLRNVAVANLWFQQKLTSCFTVHSTDSTAHDCVNGTACSDLLAQDDLSRYVLCSDCSEDGLGHCEQ
jgi:hypothetical protein